MPFRVFSREEKADILGVEISNKGRRAKPLGRMLQREDGAFIWILTRTEDFIEHRLLLVAEDTTAFGVWLHSNNHLDLLEPRTFDTRANHSGITTANWVRIAQAAQDTQAEGIKHITYEVTPPRDKNRCKSQWVSVVEAAKRMNLAPETVRRRIRSGDLNARRVKHGIQFFYEVEMSNQRAQCDVQMPRPTVETSTAFVTPRVTLVETAPAVVSAPASIEVTDPSVEIIMTLFQRLDAQKQATLLQSLMKVWTI